MKFWLRLLIRMLLLRRRRKGRSPKRKIVTTLPRLRKIIHQM